MSLITTITRHGITLPAEAIGAFCRRWKIRELAVFGSFLRDDFADRSDIDFLIDPLTGTTWTLDDLLTMEQELTTLLDRKAEIVERRAVEKSENYIRRRHILATAEPIYVER
jgi:uncharacterized protein